MGLGEIQAKYGIVFRHRQWTIYSGGFVPQAVVRERRAVCADGIRQAGLKRACAGYRIGRQRRSIEGVEEFIIDMTIASPEFLTPFYRPFEADDFQGRHGQRVLAARR